MQFIILSTLSKNMILYHLFFFKLMVTQLSNTPTNLSLLNSNKTLYNFPHNTSQKERDNLCRFLDWGIRYRLLRV